MNQVVTLYHGSPAKFDNFNLSNFGKHDAGQWGKGIYLTDKEDLAKLYTEGDEGYIYKCEVILKNPFIIDALTEAYKFVELADTNEEAIQILKDEGYDSIIVKDDPIYSPLLKSMFKANQYIIFDPSDIKIVEVKPLKENINESLSTHSKLNDRLFNGKKLKPQVKLALINVANKLVEDLKENNIPIKVYDYWFLGSNAAYNYNPDSDIDVHIIVDIDDLKCDKNLLSILYNYAKASFNKDHDIKVKGHPVELYLEDIATTAVSNGIYSLKKDEWIKEPAPADDRDYYPEETKEYQELLKEYRKIKDGPIDKINEFIDNIYIMRKESLTKNGEFGLGNMMFKEFRNSGKLQELKDKVKELESAELTLEHLN